MMVASGGRSSSGLVMRRPWWRRAGSAIMASAAPGMVAGYWASAMWKPQLVWGFLVAGAAGRVALRLWRAMMTRDGSRSLPRYWRPAATSAWPSVPMEQVMSWMRAPGPRAWARRAARTRATGSGVACWADSWQTIQSAGRCFWAAVRRARPSSMAARPYSPRCSRR